MLAIRALTIPLIFINSWLAFFGGWTTVGEKRDCTKKTAISRWLHSECTISSRLSRPLRKAKITGWKSNNTSSTLKRLQWVAMMMITETVLLSKRWYTVEDRKIEMYVCMQKRKNGVGTGRLLTISPCSWYSYFSIVFAFRNQFVITLSINVWV